jgi:aminoglycoside 6'-N-acetyltransferase I
VHVFKCSAENAAEWAAIRAELWPSSQAGEHRVDIGNMLAQPDKFVAFFLREDEAVSGFAEGSLRFEYVNGCESTPVVFLEGIYVRPEHRRRGIARRLGSEIEHWGREKGCSEMASDALVGNDVSHRMHAALGFEETERVVCFRKVLT